MLKEFYFSSLTPGMNVSREARLFRARRPRAVKRPADLEHAAFWSVSELAETVASLPRVGCVCVCSV